MSSRLYALDAECPHCGKRPKVRMYEDGRNALALLPPKTKVMDVTCATATCQRLSSPTSFDITARAVQDGKEVRLNSF